MDYIDGTLEDKLNLVRKSFSPNICRCLPTFTRDLMIEAIDAKIKELVLLHDFRSKHKSSRILGNKELTESRIILYQELKKQLEAL